PAAMMTTPPDQPARRPAVLRVSSDMAAARFAGRGGPNVYYWTDPLADGARGYTFEECKKWQGPLTPAADPAAVGLPVPEPPWDAADPSAELERRPEEPWNAFRLKPSLPQLRDRVAVLLGVRNLPVREKRIYNFWPPPPLDAVASNPRVKVWWPDPPAELRGNLPRYH